MPPRKEPETPPEDVPPEPAPAPQPPPGMVAVRLTIRPDTDRHVRPSELPQLRSQRLIVEDPAPEGAAAKAAKAAGKDNP